MESEPWGSLTITESPLTTGGLDHLAIAAPDGIGNADWVQVRPPSTEWITASNPESVAVCASPQASVGLTNWGIAVAAIVEATDQLVPPSELARSVVASAGNAGPGVGGGVEVWVPPPASGESETVSYWELLRISVIQPCLSSTNWTSPGPL